MDKQGDRNRLIVVPERHATLDLTNVYGEESIQKWLNGRNLTANSRRWAHRGIRLPASLYRSMPQLHRKRPVHSFITG